MRIHPFAMLVTLYTLTACSHATPENANAAAAQSSSPTPAAKAGHPQYVCTDAPLSADDIALYLSVMRAAAGIVQHPTAPDITERQRAKAQAAANRTAIATDQQRNGAARASADAANQKMMAVMQAAQKSGDYSAITAAANAAKSANAALPTTPVIMPPQQTPAQQAESSRVMSMDGGAADEVVVEQRGIDSDRWDCITRKVEAAIPPPGEAYGDGDPITLTAQQRINEAKWEAQIAANKKLLSPHRSEILSLETVVRAMHPDN